MAGSAARRVTVVGAGVVGLTIAHELARHGDAVTVLADQWAAESVSGVAGGLFFPYATDSSPGATALFSRSRERFEALAADPATGVALREGTLVERSPAPDRGWTACAPAWREARPEELPAGATSGVRVRLPVADVPRYLTWLTAACTRHGVGFRRTAVSTLAVLDPTDLVVVAAGLQSGAILGDDTSLVPVRGQVVRLANPGLTDWYVDDDHPQGLTYVIPRGEDIVCGGTAEPGEWQARWDERTEQGILARVTAAVPALSGLPVLSRDVGLRPGRPTMRLEHVPGHAVPVIACYGHGGAGLSASWGSAEAVLRLADDVAG